MSVGEFCDRGVIVVDSNDSVQVAAGLMREHHVGDVVIVEEQNGRRVPVGIVTDRDLVIEILAPGLAPEDLTVGDVVTEPPVTAREEDGLLETLARMRTAAVRRIPVVDREGGLVGILTVDDVIGLLSEVVGDLAGLVDRQRDREKSKRP